MVKEGSGDSARGVEFIAANAAAEPTAYVGKAARNHATQTPKQEDHGA